MNHSSYNSQEEVETLNKWYSPYKEKAFIDHISTLKLLQISSFLLEVGGGAGMHGRVINCSTRCTYVHSDYAYPLCLSTKEKALKTVQMDALAMSFKDESIDCILTVGVSTIVESVDIRLKQFREFYRVLKPAGHLIMVTGRRTTWRRGQHCLDRHDMQALLELGFTNPRVSLWGLIPGRWWGARNYCTYKRIEKILSGIGLGVRKIVTLEK